MREDLIERLRNAVGVGPFSHAVSDESPVVVTAGLLREAAELARRVEGAAHGRVVVPYGDGPDFALANDETMEFANVRHLRNQRVRIVPEAGQGGGDG